MRRRRRFLSLSLLTLRMHNRINEKKIYIYVDAIAVAVAATFAVIIFIAELILLLFYSSYKHIIRIVCLLFFLFIIAGAQCVDFQLSDKCGIEQIILVYFYCTEILLFPSLFSFFFHFNFGYFFRSILYFISLMINFI